MATLALNNPTVKIVERTQAAFIGDGARWSSNIGPTPAKLRPNRRSLPHRPLRTPLTPPTGPPGPARPSQLCYD